jgi:hypothetical protein
MLEQYLLYWDQRRATNCETTGRVVRPHCVLLVVATLSARSSSITSYSQLHFNFSYISLILDASDSESVLQHATTERLP